MKKVKKVKKNHLKIRKKEKMKKKVKNQKKIVKKVKKKVENKVLKLLPLIQMNLIQVKIIKLQL